MTQTEAAISLPLAIRSVGLLGILLAIATVLLSTLLFAERYEFSIFTTYLSDMGARAGWSQVVFNSGMLISAPVRYLFLILLILLFRHRGAGPSLSVILFVVGTLAVMGSIGLSAIPHSLNMTLHKTSALIYFFGVVVLQALIGAHEWRAGMPSLLSVSCFTVVGVYLIFAVLLMLVGKAEGITRDTPVIWEWLAFLSLMFWLGAHSLILGNAERRKK